MYQRPRYLPVQLFKVGLKVLLVLVCLDLVASHEFCGHSVGSERKFGAIRNKRYSMNLRIGERPEEHSVQAPTKFQQHDQIHDTNLGKLSKETNRNQEKEARTECAKLTPSSRISADSASVEGDCNTRTIETAVFIDQSLDSKFIGLSGGLVELNKLVLTIMNQVQYLFKYSSMRVPIKIKLVLVEHLKDIDRSGGKAPNTERGDIDAYLSNFCNWQHARLEQEKRLWWDHAILLSGLDLYKATPSKNHTGVLGLAWVGGMCKGNYSCTINEASNLESAFVIAHEIGHSLGIMHDGQRNTCDPNGFIMSEKTGAGKVHWSRCSNNYLEDSIKRRQLSCLDVEQSSISDPLYDLSKLKSPGQVYTINEQCKLAFGNNYTSFVTRQEPFNAVCRELWCVAGTWAKAAHPALEGSVCGSQDRVCHEDVAGWPADGADDPILECPVVGRHLDDDQRVCWEFADHQKTSHKRSMVALAQCWTTIVVADNLYL